ncbi:ribosomal protein S8 [Desulfarculus baarsii DSM 2075]|uniref:Small ribosomal subunit protein uS8 n=1 Tax=Desulfarculus baarsii (strain ATCC 33931 / DSM 2075 / LMG 7858 / VKM B-1802 / 2st14) TaxID=644282 RepID=E1QKR8_DESB2|nr:30S ribosomal protein S8 [Desulfarculus baarsii]ADK86277.1 ribosomal protein S8 [Desulfarculus baarsii DSM 2075]
MSMHDPIADMLTRIRNAIMARQTEVNLPSSSIKAAIAETLVQEGYIAGYEVVPGSPQATLSLKLRYHGSRSVIEGLKRVSKPSRRVYVPHTEVQKIRSGLGIAILSTNKGVMCDREARKAKVGGEVLCEIW